LRGVAHGRRGCTSGDVRRGVERRGKRSTVGIDCPAREGGTVSMPFPSPVLLFAVFWKSGVVLGAALCIAQVLKNRSADLRRLVFSTTIVAMFVAAAAAPALPRWTAVTPPWFRSHRALPPAIAGRSPASRMAGETTEESPLSS